MQHLIKEAEQTLEQAKSSGKHGILWTGGKDSMVILHLWRQLFDEDIPLLVIDTYNQFDEIYDFRAEIAEEWGLTLDIRANEEFLEEVIWNEDDERGFAWDGPKTEACCGALKIDVISDFISDGYEHLIVGRRSADIGEELKEVEQTREPVPHIRYHPIASWPNPLVEAYIRRESIPLPNLYYEGYRHTDCVDCTMTGEEGDDWSGVSQEQQQQLQQLREMGYM